MKSEKTNKLALRVEKKGLALKREEGLKFAATILWKDYLTTIWPNCSQIGGEDINTELKTYVQLTKILLWRKKKAYFLRRLASNEIVTPKCPVSSILIDTRGAQLSQTIEL